ncbi:hypothetical protein BKA57DRAFT_310851 [Linnemannia elongata]|nr:hypothetical protein BKA57DRAFT_310851 [Linnemannia elongata]
MVLNAAMQYPWSLIWAIRFRCHGLASTLFFLMSCPFRCLAFFFCSCCCCCLLFAVCMVTVEQKPKPKRLFYFLEFLSMMMSLSFVLVCVYLLGGFMRVVVLYVNRCMSELSCPCGSFSFPLCRCCSVSFHCFFLVSLVLFSLSPWTSAPLV